MTREALEAELQDYLDGRMPEDRRREFEARAAGDPALARRIRAHRDDAEALRAGTVSLSPDFHARLRARFEERHAAAPRWFRLASWEAAGLAAAVIVAAVLFVPLFVGDRPGPAVPAGPAARPPVQAESRSVAPQEPVREGRADARDEAGAAADRRMSKPEQPARKNAPESEPGKEKKVLADAAAPGAAAPQPAREEFAPAPPPPSAPSATESNALEKGPAAGTSFGGEVAGEPYAAAQAAPPAQLARTARRSPVGIAVPAGVVEPGAAREVVDPGDWTEVASRAEASAIGRYDPALRVVLVGERDGGLDCPASTTVETAAAHEIRLAGAGPDPPRDGHGCAFVLPRDGKPVRLSGPRR